MLAFKRETAHRAVATEDDAGCFCLCTQRWNAEPAFAKPTGGQAPNIQRTMENGRHGLLLFPEQNETAATINQCVVFRINFGPHAYSI
jgi:hypothetical protein